MNSLQRLYLFTSYQGFFLYLVFLQGTALTLKSQVVPLNLSVQHGSHVEAGLQDLVEFLVNTHRVHLLSMQIHNYRFLAGCHVLEHHHHAWFYCKK